MRCDVMCMGPRGVECGYTHNIWYGFPHVAPFYLHHVQSHSSLSPAPHTRLCNTAMDPMTDLHEAALNGSTERTIAALSRGVIGVDQTSRRGVTSLMVASCFGHERVVQVLQNRGANLALVDDNGFTALHCSAQKGHLAVTKLLVKAGADLEAKTFAGLTPLHLAAHNGHSEVMRALTEAGALINSREKHHGTPLYLAAQRGHLAAIRVLLRAKADPLLTTWNPSGHTVVPLDTAARKGHSEVVAELIHEYGIEGCGGTSGGVDALGWAAANRHVDIMGILTNVGVVDTGEALQKAAGSGQESSVKFLLQQHLWRANGGGAEYLNSRDHYVGATSLMYSIQARRPCSPRITRMLVDAGADTSTAVRFKLSDGRISFNTPLALVDQYIGDENMGGEASSTESQLHSLEGSRRLLMRVEAVHAVSWLWASNVPSITHAAAAAEGAGRATERASTPQISLVLSILRRRVGRARVLWAALHR